MCLKEHRCTFLNKKKRSKRVQVTFNNEQWRVIKKFKGVMGESNSDVVRNIVLAWLSEKSFVTSEVNKRKV